MSEMNISVSEAMEKVRDHLETQGISRSERLHLTYMDFVNAGYSESEADQIIRDIEYINT